MAPFDGSSSAAEPFILAGIPGMEQLHIWLSMPFCSLYLGAPLGNAGLLLTVRAERSLPQPLPLFLCLLALADLALPSTAVPRTLALFWFRAREISLGACLTQMFFLHFIRSAESLILLAVAFDRFAAICFPLRHGALLTPSVVAKAGLAALLRSFCLIFPRVFLLRRLPFCGHRVIPHTYCEHIGVARLACADISASVWYGLVVPFSAILLDLILIAVSYAFILLDLILIAVSYAFILLDLILIAASYAFILLDLILIAASYAFILLDLILIAVSYAFILLDLILISASYAFILLALGRFPWGSARLQALHTCSSHLCVLLLFCVPAAFTALTQRFGHHVPAELHILLASLYVLLPPLLNPAVYGLRTQQIRDRVVRVLICPQSHSLRPRG